MIDSKKPRFKIERLEERIAPSAFHGGGGGSGGNKGGSGGHKGGSGGHKGGSGGHKGGSGGHKGGHDSSPCCVSKGGCC